MLFFAKNRQPKQPGQEKSLYPILHVADSLKAYQQELVTKEVASLSELGRVGSAFSGVLSEADQFLLNAKTVKGLHVVSMSRPGLTTDDMRKMGDFLRDKDASVVALLAGVNDGKITLQAICGKEAVARGVKAGEIIKTIAPICGGKGGGRPDSAMGGGSDLLKLDDALAALDDFVNEKAK